jgi:hypothetical protein
MKFLSRLTLFLLLPSLLIAFNATSGKAEINGKMLLENCKEAVKYIENKNDSSINHSAVNFCIGYISGVNDLHTKFIDSVACFEPPIYCIPANTQIEEMIKIVVKFLEQHPQDLTYQGAALTVSALRDVYPCNYGTPQK